MKKMIVLMSIFITISSFAEDAKRLQEMNLTELSEAKGIRVAKLKELIAPSFEAGEEGLPLEKMDDRITDVFIENALKNYLEIRSLRDLSEDTEYPIKKLRSIIGLEIGKSGYEKPLRDLGISDEAINRAIRIYEEDQTDFMWNIVAIGMIIVFISLILTGLTVALLEYIHRLDTERLRRKTSTVPSVTAVETSSDAETHDSRRARRQRETIQAKSSANDTPDAQSVVAIAAAIRLHESAIEEANRILVTWTRASVSMWKANRTMPNRRFFEKRRG